MTAPVAASAPLLEVRDLKKYFLRKAALFGRDPDPIRAVDGVSFDIHPGETLGLVGESGCGKTTTGRAILRLVEPTSGVVRFDGHDVPTLGAGDLRRLRRRMQIVFQDPFSSLNPRMTIGAIVREGLTIHRIAEGAAADLRVRQLLDEVGLRPEYASRYPHEFSGGQRQRVGIARALSVEPSFIVCDEPVSALDVSVQAQILNLMKDLQREHNLSYVMVSHDLAVVYYMADTIAVMYLGKIVEIGDAESVFRSPAHPYTQGLLDVVPVPDPVEARLRRGRQVTGELPSPVNPPSGCRFRTRCPKAQEICAVEEPLLEPFSPTQQAACHFPMKTPVALTSRSSISE